MLAYKAFAKIKIKAFFYWWYFVVIHSSINLGKTKRGTHYVVCLAKMFNLFLLLLLFILVIVPFYKACVEFIVCV